MGTSKDEDQPLTLPATRIDTQWINIDTIESWISDCDNLHECMKGSRFGTGPTWVIDVQEECLVSGASLWDGARYCALSYVWGQVETTKLTVHTIPLFQTPGAFSATQVDVVIPKTVRHAMGLVSLIGQRYLWVDALCVAQDDYAHFGTELRNMGAIYNRAYVTIVAATAWDADEGLRGLPGITPRRQLAANYADDLIKYWNPKFMIWTSRGWTFQEGQLSRRMLMFCDQTIIWNCHKFTVDEAGQIRTRIEKKKSEDDNDEVAPVVQRLSALATESDSGDCRTQLANFFDIISDYNCRNFTQPTDISIAFQGLVSALTERAAPEGCFWLGALWGLPVACFHDALLWGTSFHIVLQRRDIPSWSWLQLEGTVCLIDDKVFDFVPDGDSEPACDIAFTPSRTTADNVASYGGQSVGGTDSNDTAGPRKMLSDIRRETLERDLARGLSPQLHIMAEVKEFVALGATPFVTTAPCCGLGYVDMNWPTLAQPNFSIVIPDSLDAEFERNKSCVTLMAVSRMRGRFRKLGKFGCVNALWIELDRDTGIARRLGQARVREEVWDLEPPPESQYRGSEFIPIILV